MSRIPYSQIYISLFQSAAPSEQLLTAVLIALSGNIGPKRGRGSFCSRPSYFPLNHYLVGSFRLENSSALFFLSFSGWTENIVENHHLSIWVDSTEQKPEQKHGNFQTSPINNNRVVGFLPIPPCTSGTRFGSHPGEPVKVGSFRGLRVVQVKTNIVSSFLGGKTPCTTV